MRATITPKGKTRKEINFLRGEKIDVGIDVHKKTYSVTFWSEHRQKVVSRWTQPADPDALLRRLSEYKRRVKDVVYEAGPTGYQLVRALRGAKFRADVIAPSRTPRTTGQEAKSDRLDSRKLAMWSAKNLLRPVRVPTEEQEADRQVFRMRQDAVKKRRRIKQQIKSFLLQYGIAEPEGLATWARRGVAALRKMSLCEQLRFSLDMFLGDLDHGEAQVRRADAALRRLAATERHREVIAALRTTPGVGLVTAMALRTELIDPERFTDGREVSAMAGLAPMVSRTGATVREGSLMKCGNTRLRTMLVEAAWRWAARDPWAKDNYHRLARNTGDKKKAIVGVARRLLIILWRISVTGESYRARPVEEPGERPRSKQRKKANARHPRPRPSMKAKKTAPIRSKKQQALLLTRSAR